MALAIVYNLMLLYCIVTNVVATEATKNCIIHRLIVIYAGIINTLIATDLGCGRYSAYIYAALSCRHLCFFFTYLPVYLILGN